MSISRRTALMGATAAAVVTGAITAPLAINAEASQVDESALPISAPRRIRDKEHLRYVASHRIAHHRRIWATGNHLWPVMAQKSAINL